jgi:hypothetical protein
MVEHINKLSDRFLYHYSKPFFFFPSLFNSFSMAKVYPQVPSFSPHMTSKRESFTVWMKSLVYQTNGCTVYNTNGDIVYRVDNYDKKGSNEVHLMDLRGKVLFTIRRKVY